MTNQLKMLVGVAMFAALALAGALGGFAFGTAQPVEAQAASATRSFDPATVAPGGTVTVTITASNYGAAGGVIETLPAGFSYVSSSLDGSQVTNLDGNRQRFTLQGDSSFTYRVTASSTVGSYTFSGMLRDSDRNDHTVGGATMVTVSTASSDATLSALSLSQGTLMPDFMADTTSYTAMVDYSVTSVDVTARANHAEATVSGTGAHALAEGANTITVTVTAEDGTTTMTYTITVDRAMASTVRALPTDPGAAAQITVNFPLSHGLNIDESIVIEVGDDLGVPTAIAAGNVSIADGVNTASPRSVVVETDDVAERFKITVFIGDMSDADGAQNLRSGNITVTFRQEAGITNRTEGGDDDWFYRSSREDALTKIDNVYAVPRLVELSSYKDARGEDIIAIAKGFKNGTTVRFWRDANKDGSVDGTEVTLCSATASGDDIAECTFTVSNPPFVGGTTGNYINAIDGRGQKATAALPSFNLEPSMAASPTQGSPGDNVNVQLYDFKKDDTVKKIDFGRSFPVCDESIEAPRESKDCPSGTVGDDGGLSFSFEIPPGITPGIQQMRVFAGQGEMKDNEEVFRDVDDNFTVGLGGLQASSTDVLPNQRISLTGSGFTTSRGQASAYIGEPTTAKMGSCEDKITEGEDQGKYYNGAVLLGGTQILWDRVNGGDAIEVTSGGTWAGSIDLPINSLTTTASTRELKIIDCRAGVATMDLTFPDREVSMSPERGRVGSEVIITGKNFPAFNDDGSDVEITVEYDAGDDETDDDDVEPDGLGSFTIILEVPEDAGIPSNNTVTVQFKDDTDATVTETRTHRVPQGTVDFGAASGAEGSLLTITAEGFARYTSVSEVMFGDRDITPSPKPSTDTTGDVEFQVRIPGSDPGIYIIKVEVADVSATQTFTVVSGSGVVDGSVESILANVMSEDALDRVFKFNNETKEWQWHINDPAFTSTNNLGGLSSGDLVWIKVAKSVTADVLGTSVTLSCINEGMENEDCWNQISIP